MTERNMQVVRSGHEARSAGRIADWIDTLDPNIEWDISAYPIPGFPQRGAGRGEFVAHITKYWSVWNDYSQEVQEMLDMGDQVLVVLREHARMRNSDATLDREVATVWTMQDGRRVRFRAYGSRAEALEAVGHRN